MRETQSQPFKRSENSSSNHLLCLLRLFRDGKSSKSKVTENVRRLRHKGKLISFKQKRKRKKTKTKKHQCVARVVTRSELGIGVGKSHLRESRTRGHEKKKSLQVQNATRSRIFSSTCIDDDDAASVEPSSVLSQLCAKKRRDLLPREQIKEHGLSLRENNTRSNNISCVSREPVRPRGRLIRGALVAVTVASNLGQPHGVADQNSTTSRRTASTPFSLFRASRLRLRHLIPRHTYTHSPTQ